MKTVHTSPWMRVDVGQAAAARRAEVLIEGYIGYDWEKQEKGQRQNQAAALRQELKALAALDVDEIEVRINSPGGSVAHGIAIHDLLAESKANVTTHVEGMTASAATVIAQAGKVRRMSANALYLVHRVSTWALGNIKDIELAAKDAKAMDERLAGIYAKRSGRGAEELLALMDRGSGRGEWLSADEALAAGLVDESVEPRAMAAAVDLTAAAALNLPPVPLRYVGLLRPEFASTEQTPQPVNGAACGAAGAKQPPGDKKMKLTTEQIAKIESRFGAEAALAAVKEDLDYAAAVDRGADALAKQLAEARAATAAVTTERDAAKAEAADLKAKLEAAEAKLADPLAPNSKRETPPPPPAAPKPIPEAHADLVQAGKSPAEAWAVLRSERPQDYAAHFSM